MNQTVQCKSRTGSVQIIASKSYAHRLIILAALNDRPVDILCNSTSNDIEATVRCMNALGANITHTEHGIIHVEPLKSAPKRACELDCGESGSTLRFLLPVVGAFGAKVRFIMHGRLGERPLAPLDTLLTRHGMRIKKKDNVLHCSGRLRAGEYSIAGNVSSQYVSGLLLALPLLKDNSTLRVTDALESSAYVDITLSALRLANAAVTASDMHHYDIRGKIGYSLKDRCIVEGDWSNAAFFLCMGALSKSGITVLGLNADSRQGDKKIVDILSEMGAEIIMQGDSVTVKRGTLKPVTVDASPIPDLIPAICALAAAAEGNTLITNAARLRLKESDRLASTKNMLASLGVNVTELCDGLIVHGTGHLRGGSIDSCNDHRIAMAAAVAACAADGEVTICNSECVNKSYPTFFEELAALDTEGENE